MLPGHRKVHTVATPRNGGIGIFWGFALPLLAGIVAVCCLNHLLTDFHSSLPYTGTHAETDVRLAGINVPPRLLPYVPGMRHDVPLALLFLGATLATHMLGLMDDRKAMAPWPKLLAQLFIAATLVALGEMCGAGSFRILTFLGAFPSPASSPPLSSPSAGSLR